jgi:hypothetical protein
MNLEIYLYLVFILVSHSSDIRAFYTLGEKRQSIIQTTNYVISNLRTSYVFILYVFTLLLRFTECILLGICMIAYLVNWVRNVYRFEKFMESIDKK